MLSLFFMSLVCPFYCRPDKNVQSIVRFGHFYRGSDRKKVQRYKCNLCHRGFSRATSSPCYRQNKRQINSAVLSLLVSGVSQRRIALLLNIHHITVARKLKFLGLQARLANLHARLAMPPVHSLQFDDLETFEHTKLKPLSITLAVQKRTRRILGFEVSRMPASGLLANRSVKKYGRREDTRAEGRDRLFRRIKGAVKPDALIESDSNPHYPRLVQTHFPYGHYKMHPGLRGANTGQGELKRAKFDPLFSLNHTCAMFRANVNRLFRKTWCTTKKLQPLIDHLEIYTAFHNGVLI